MRILLAEDEQLLAEYLKRSLTAAGNDVTVSSDGEAAVQNILRHSYDVLVLDIIMPKKTGLEVCREAREAGIKTPIIFLTSQDAEASRVEGLDAGGDDYMVKPFSYPELEARLRALHRRPKDIIEDIIEIGDIRFSAVLHKVWKREREMALRSKEFDLVEYLVRNRGRVVPREEIFSHVWGVQAENASNRVDACIKEVRSKLGKQLIQTIHGVGYTIE